MKKRLGLLAIFLAGALASRALVPSPTAVPMLPLTALTRLLAPSLEAAYVPSAVKSITAIALTSAGLTQTVSVIAANSILFGNGTNSPQASPNGQIYAVITNGTTITGTGGAGGGASYAGQLVEFYGNFVVPGGQGCTGITITPPATSGSVTIPSVVVARTALASTGFSGSDSTSTWVVAPKTVLAGSTTVTTTLNTAPATAQSVTAGFCYLQFR